MDVKLPSLGEGAESGTVVKVLVSEGDVIEKDQPILEMENEKAVAPIPSEAGGKVGQIYVKVGDELSVGDSILDLTETREGEEKKEKKRPEPRPKARETEEKEPPPSRKSEEAPEEEQVERRAPAGPSIRRFARQIGLDFSRVAGSGRGGRIQMGDVRAYVEWLQRRAFEEYEPGPPKETPLPDFNEWGETERQSLSGIRKAIGHRLSLAWNTIPHVTQFDEAEIDGLLQLKAKYDAEYEKRGVKLTLTALLTKAVVSVLKEFPMFNASIDAAQGEVVLKKYYNVGLAAATDRGLVVPVIRGVNRKSLLEVAREIQEMAGRAASGEIRAEEMKGASFTISNQGGIGSAHFTPIINPPEVAILGVGRAKKTPGLRDGNVVEVTRLPLALSYDHRLIDGADAAGFMVALVKRLEAVKEDEVRP